MKEDHPFHKSQFSPWEPGIMIEYPGGKQYFPAQWVEDMISITLQKCGDKIVVRTVYQPKGGNITQS